jgi:hypothetical protein
MTWDINGCIYEVDGGIRYVINGMVLEWSKKL